jgi:two-component system phosphate regulon sensor histidine kinase PhoR
MRKRRVSLFIGIAVFALLGIVITQLYWVKDAHQLREELFKQRVIVAMKSVSTQILDAQIDSSAKYLLEPCDTLAFGNKPIEEVIDAQLLDSLLNSEFLAMGIENEYHYGVFNERDSTFILGPYHDHESELLTSEHRVSLTCIYKRDVYLLGVEFPYQDRYILYGMTFLIALSVLFLLILSFSFYMVIKLMFRQKRLSEIKSDFINNMTHEFKTPIATISLSSEMLLKPDVNKFPYKTKRYASVIFDENARLQKQVDQVLQLSVLEKGSFKLKRKEIDIHRIIRKMAEHVSVKVQKKGGHITTRLDAHTHNIIADKTHISNIISNLIDNAIKYSSEAPEINIYTRMEGKNLLIVISDNGIGISTENQKHVFKKLYRVPTGNIHDVKGFGLGLFYVKTMVEAHGGTIKVKSELHKGTTFTIALPTT